MTAMSRRTTVPMQRSGRERRTVLVTGATGVVGQALIPRLVDHGASDVICLTHRSVMGARSGKRHAGSVSTVQGDVARPDLGLGAREYRDLAARVDSVVHAAALTDFAGPDETLHRVNVGGTEHALAMADAAGAQFVHVSTAYLDARGEGQRGHIAARYAASKRAAEAVVKASGVGHSIVRPSIVIGDSRTGVMASAQGLHRAAGAVLSGIAPILPFGASWPFDFIPQDVVADTVAGIVEHERIGEELWVTAGRQALTLAQAVDVVMATGRKLGIKVDTPRFVSPEQFDRIIGPVFLPALPATMRNTITRLLDFFAVYLDMDEPMPSSLPALEEQGVAVLPDLAESLRRSLHWYATQEQIRAARAVSMSRDEAVA
ncbi:MAG TPA: SDR family oxidoreductase [Mycobacterium sp.]|nr:SDR family oxidoreductase [Mycobacterium sp.]